MCCHPDFHSILIALVFCVFWKVWEWSPPCFETAVVMLCCIQVAGRFFSQEFAFDSGLNVTWVTRKALETILSQYFDSAVDPFFVVLYGEYLIEVT
jgi:hypothetical protein